MPIGEHLAKCHDCLRSWICGDCIPQLCPECSELRRKARTVGVPGRCKDCGGILSKTDGSCFDCRVFGKAGARSIQ